MCSWFLLFPAWIIGQSPLFVVESTSDPFVSPILFVELSLTRLRLSTSTAFDRTYMGSPCEILSCVGLLDSASRGHRGHLASKGVLSTKQS